MFGDVGGGFEDFEIFRSLVLLLASTVTILFSCLTLVSSLCINLLSGPSGGSVGAGA